MSRLEFFLDNIEILIAGASPLIFAMIMSVKKVDRRNNLTRFHIEAKKRQDAINSKSKSMF